MNCLQRSLSFLRVQGHKLPQKELQAKRPLPWTWLMVPTPLGHSLHRSPRICIIESNSHSYLDLSQEPCSLCYNSKLTRLTLQNGPIQSGDGSGSSGHTSDIITVEARGREPAAPSITVIFADDAQPGPHRGAMGENEEEEGQEEEADGASGATRRSATCPVNRLGATGTLSTSRLASVASMLDLNVAK